MFYQKNLSQKWNKMNTATAAQYVHSILSDKGHKWKINGKRVDPTFDDVDNMLKLMYEDISKGDYDSIESGGILLKRDGDKIDLYVHLGEIDEDFSI